MPTNRSAERLRDRAIAWIRKFLSDFPGPVRASAVVESGAVAGFNRRLLQHARRELAGDVFVRRAVGSPGYWTWELRRHGT